MFSEDNPPPKPKRPPKELLNRYSYQQEPQQNNSRPVSNILQSLFCEFVEPTSSSIYMYDLQSPMIYMYNYIIFPSEILQPADEVSEHFILQSESCTSFYLVTSNNTYNIPLS